MGFERVGGESLFDSDLTSEPYAKNWVTTKNKKPETRLTRASGVRSSSKVLTSFKEWSF